MFRALENWKMIKGGQKPKWMSLSLGEALVEPRSLWADLWAWKSWSSGWSTRCFYWEGMVSDMRAIQADVGERVMWRANPGVCVSNCGEWEGLWLGWNEPFNIWTIKRWRQHFVLTTRFIYTCISWNIEAKIDCNPSQNGADLHVLPSVLYVL